MHHSWYGNVKPNLMGHNTLMYKRIDPQLRQQQRRAWNTPVVWPVILVLLILLISIVPAVITYRRKEQSAAKQQLVEPKGEKG